MLFHSQSFKEGTSAAQSAVPRNLDLDAVVSVGSDQGDIISVSSEHAVLSDLTSSEDIVTSSPLPPGPTATAEPSATELSAKNMSPQTVPRVVVTSPTTVSPFSVPATPNSASPEVPAAELISRSVANPEMPNDSSHATSLCQTIPKELRAEIIHDNALTMTLQFAASAADDQLPNKYYAIPSLQLSHARHRKLSDPNPVSPASSEDSESTSLCSCLTRLYTTTYYKIKAAFGPSNPHQEPCNYSPGNKLDV